MACSCGIFPKTARLCLEMFSLLLSPPGKAFYYVYLYVHAYMQMCMFVRVCVCVCERERERERERSQMQFHLPDHQTPTPTPTLTQQAHHPTTRPPTPRPWQTQTEDGPAGSWARKSNEESEARRAARADRLPRRAFSIAALTSGSACLDALARS
jgi:hypothetical protein